jgi:hypothetical protein
VQLQDLNSYIASTMLTPKTYQFIIDLNVAGVRDFTYGALTGKTANDSVIVDPTPGANTVLTTGLDQDRWCAGGMNGIFFPFNPAAKNLVDLPGFRLLLEFDVGLFGRRLSYALDSQGIGVITGGQGSII